MQNVFAPVAAATFIIFGAVVALNVPGLPSARRWLPVAGLSAAFAAFSVVTVALEGPTGFWVGNTRATSGATKAGSIWCSRAVWHGP
jgi:hypothetical protein